MPKSMTPDRTESSIYLVERMVLILLLDEKLQSQFFVGVSFRLRNGEPFVGIVIKIRRNRFQGSIRISGAIPDDIKEPVKLERQFHPSFLTDGIPQLTLIGSGNIRQQSARNGSVTRE